MKRLGLTLVVTCLAVACAWANRDYTTNTVTVTVQGKDGKPVAGAAVRAWSDTWGHFQPWTRYETAKTDAKGQVRFKMIVGEWSLFAAAEGLYLADVHRKVTRATQELTIKPNNTLRLSAKDLDGTPLDDAEIHICTVEHRPVVPMMVAGKLKTGKAELAVIGKQTYGVMLVRQPASDKPGLVLHWDRVIGSYAFAPSKDLLRKFTISAKDLDGGPGEMEARFSFPELTCVWDYRSNPGEFTSKIKEKAVFWVEPAYVAVEGVLAKNGWVCRYFPSHFDLQKNREMEVAYGGPHTIVPKVYAREGYLSATWLRTEDAFGHIAYEVKNPEKKLPPLEFHFRDKDSKELYGKVEGGQWAPAVRFDKDLTPDVVSFDGVIDYGPFGKRVFKGDPRSEEFGCNTDVILKSPHFEIISTKDAQIVSQAQQMLDWMEEVYRQYGNLWGLTTYLADKPTTIYFEPNLSNAIGGLSYGNKLINAWQTDLLDSGDPKRNALCHMQNILCHEYFHTCQAIPEMKWGGRTLYPDSWIGESMPQVGFNRLYQRYYGPVTAKMHQGIYMDGFLKMMAGEKGFGNKEAIWEEICYDFGDIALRRGLELLGDADWKGWDWMVKSNVDVKVALMALYKHVTGKNYAYMARLAGDKDVTDKLVDQAAALIVSDVAPFPSRCEAPFIKDWLVLGSFEDSKHRFLAKEQVKGEGALRPRAGQTMLGKAWVKFVSDRADGFVDLEKPCGEVDHAGGYAFATVKADKAGRALVWFGSDDGAKLWINGKLVIDRDYHRPANPDDFIVPIELKAGENTVMVKIDEDVAQWGFYLRFTDPDGRSAAKQ